ncbi:MAG: hypothetical protein IJY39_10120 [Clostridia bacterium]|nr:hypothetical protein [Clostridia bacterium]
MQIEYKGATPIEKNVIVVDEQGNEYEATYPKRAKGLVKSGRARFVDENKICLACPPNEYLEDNKMTDHTTDNIVEVKKAEETVSETLSIDYILAQIEKIVENTAYITAAMDSLNSVQSIGPGNIGAEEKAKGIADVVRCRETTNQQLLAFYTKVFTDLTAPKKDPLTEKMELIRNVRLSMLQELKEFYCEDELVERADSVMCDISNLCNDIYLTKN